MRRILLTCGIAALLGAVPGAAHAEVTVFSDDFSGATKPEWTGAQNITAPSSERVLGSLSGDPLGTNDVHLVLTGLPAHATFSLGADLHVLASTDADEPFTIFTTGPSAQTLQPSTTFTNNTTFMYPQCYPHACADGGADQPTQAGAERTDDPLGYGGCCGSSMYGIGSMYRLSYPAVSDSSGTLDIVFRFENMQAWHDEGWALDNVLVTVDAASGPVCTVTGTAGADRIRGTSGNDVICGLGGDDFLDGRGGNDVIYGGDGVDTLVGKGGNDTLIGEAGNDLLLPGSGDDSADGGAGTRDRVLFSDIKGAGVDVFLASGSVTGEAGSDVGSDQLSNIEQVFGSQFSDLLVANIAGVASTLKGGEGNDYLDVDDGDGLDTVVGNQGSDTCAVNAGDQARDC
jgi:Ca2+-binding RTX toxin-like protein